MSLNSEVARKSCKEAIDKMDHSELEDILWIIRRRTGECSEIHRAFISLEMMQMAKEWTR